MEQGQLSNELGDGLGEIEKGDGVEEAEDDAAMSFKLRMSQRRRSCR